MKRTNTSRLLLLLVLLGAFQSIVLGQTEKATRPKIGLVLSGGGAKGLAHIGVLKVLEEVQMPIDYISGTSMGSVIGGLYSCGYSAGTIEKIVRSLVWEELLGDRIQRKNISVEEKNEFERQLLEFPMDGFHIVMPNSMVNGQKISAMLSHYTWPAHTIHNFDSLPIPFRCVATNIETVSPVVLKSGFLADAIRASMAIPSFFSPMELDGRLLVDGGIVRNFPVQDAIDMGADIIIGVDVSAGLYKKKDLNTIFKIMDQVSSAQGAMSNLKQDSLCNYLIKPNISTYTMFSFDKMDSLIYNGEQAARAMLPELKKLADSLNNMQTVVKTRTHPFEIDSIHINAIRYEGLEKVPLNLVKGNFEIVDSGWVRLNEIECGIDRLYGTRCFERVNYKISPDKQGYILTLRCKEQHYNFFDIGFRYDPYRRINLLLSYTDRNLFLNGSKLLIDAKVGQFPGAAVQYNVHTLAHPNLGVNARLSYNIFQGRNYNPQGLLQGIYNIEHYLSEIDLYSAFSNAFMLKTGIQGEYFKFSKDIEVDDTINFNQRDISLYSRVRFDTQDRTAFPIVGINFFAEVKYVLGSRYFNGYDFDKAYWCMVANFTEYIPLERRVVLIPSFNIGISPSKKCPPTYNYFLGGFIHGEQIVFPFDGMRFMAVMSRYVYTVGLNFRFEPWKDRFLTLKTNLAGVSTTLDALMSTRQKYTSIGIAAGVRTVLGPIEFTLAKSNNNKNVYGELKFGYIF
ncbi:MAG TPA: patatin-like phospholipase family protein [Bacteroidales bacterium]|nr:patatin-like phospholipase family protein [Bacteroidales bacterium]